jgi:transcriptional regulator with XRE-family HTH domain
MPRGIELVDRLVGRNIRLFRLHRKFSQKFFADSLGLSFQQIQKYEKGINRVGSARLAKIAAILDVPIERLFDGALTKSKTREDPADLLANRYALRLAKAFARIRGDAVRHRLVELAEAVAREEAVDRRRAPTRAKTQVRTK